MKTVFETKKISGGAKVDIYSKSEDKRLYFALVHLNGERYPEKGVGVNSGQTEGIFVIEGELKVSVDDEEMICKKGDVVYFEEGKKYWVSGKGKAVVAISPAEGGKTKIIK